MRKFQLTEASTKIGRELYSCTAWRDDATGKSHVDIDVWVIRSIRKSNTRYNIGTKRRMVYVTRVAPWTRDRKGIWADNIGASDRQSFPLDGQLPMNLFPTRLQALEDEKQNIETNIRKPWADDDLKEEEALLKLVKGRITREKRAKK